MAGIQLSQFSRAGRGSFGEATHTTRPLLTSQENDGPLRIEVHHHGDEDGLHDVYDEGLGSKFRETAWKKPSQELARIHRASTMYGGGIAAVWNRDDYPLFQMGEGVGLYFIYIRRMMLFSAICTLLTMPHLLICFFGNSLTRAEMDPMRLLTFAAGNHRLTNVSDFSSTAFHPCEAGGNETVPTLFSESGATCDDHFFKVFDDPETLLTGKHGSFLIMFCDVLCCILLMVLFWVFKREIVAFEENADKENVTPADYAVEVKGLPMDAKDEEVIQHFSELFRLDQPGWTFAGWGCSSFGKKTAEMPEDVVDCGGVSVGARLEPVKTTAHSRFDHICLGTWLAECSLAHPEGDFIRQARKMTSMSEDVLQARAKVKKINSQPSSRLRRRRLRLAEEHLAKLCGGLQRRAIELESKADKFERLSWTTSGGAFVVFEHEASVARCLADYARYPLWMQPHRLRFRQRHKLQVKRAPEAANILWENLDLPNKERARRKTLTLWVTVALLGASFAVLYVSNTAEKEYSAAERAAVSRDHPGRAKHGLPHATPYIKGVDAEGGGACENGDIWVTLEGSPYQTSGQENTCVDPCLDPRSREPMACANGATLSQSQIASCLCRQEIEERGAGAIGFVREVGGGCWDYGTQYTIGKILTLVASINVVIINFGLKRVLKCMGAFERHPSVTEQAVSNTWKISLALFVNSACVVLLVNFPSSFKIIGSDAATTAALAADSAGSADWYTSTGQALITTIAINVFAPRLPDLVEHFIRGPWRRRSAGAASAISQRQLNRRWKGRNFDLSLRLSSTLMMMAVAVTFSPALPVLFPMVSVYLAITYFGDKFHLLRSCCAPPQYDGRIVEIAAHAMPVMLLCHCMFALFAFSGGAFFESDRVQGVFLSDTDGGLSGNSGAPGEILSVAGSIKLICLPYIIMPALLGLNALLNSTVGKLFRLWWSAVTCKCFRGSAKVGGPKITVTNPPYTGIFERGYPPREAIPAFFERSMGWAVREDKRGCKFLYKTREMPVKGSPGSRGKKGGGVPNGTPDLMLTWEVLRSIYPVHTYHMEDNPAYRDIVVTRNVIAKELGITTPKSPGGKLWSPIDYDAHVSSSTPSSPSFKRGRSKPSSPRQARRTHSPL